MTPTHTQNRHGRTYRYYRSAGGPRGKAQQISASAIEDFVAARMRALTGEPLAQWDRLKGRLTRVDLRADGVSIEFKTKTLSDSDLAASDRLETLGDDVYRLVTVATPMTRGGRTWLRDVSHHARAKPDDKLIRCLRRSHEILRENGLAPLAGADPLPGARGVADPYRRKIVELAFLAPDIQRAILTGRQPVGLTVQRLLDSPLPLAWDDQRALFGFAPA